MKKLVVGFILLAVLIIAGCQHGCVGAKVNSDDRYWMYYCETNPQDSECEARFGHSGGSGQGGYDAEEPGFSSGKGTEGNPIQLKEQVVEARRPAFTDEESQARFRERGEAQAGLTNNNEISEIVSAPRDYTNVESSGVVQVKESQEDFCKRVKKARYELEHSGITSEQAGAYKELFSEALYRGIEPQGYDYIEKLAFFADNLLFGREENAPLGSEKKPPVREDAWRLYLGLPQQHNAFGVSDYRPSSSQENIYYYKLNEFIALFNLKGGLSNIDYTKPYFNPDEANTLQDLSIEIDKSGGKVYIHEHRYHDDSSKLGVMAVFKLSKGQDENGYYFSYYDVWDLGGSGLETKEGIFGKPFEIYDRIYYNPETYEVIDEKDLPKACP